MLAQRQVCLTNRELDCVRLAAEGFSAKEIGRDMGITDRTVEAHLEHARLKIGARNRTHTIVEAVRQGLA